MEDKAGIEHTLARIDDHLGQLLRLGEEARQEWLSITQVAAATGLPASHVRRAVKRHELAASNAGTEGHPIWRIARADLAAWMATKKGGAAVVPPAKQLGGLVERYFGSSGD